MSMYSFTTKVLAIGCFVFYAVEAAAQRTELSLLRNTSTVDTDHVIRVSGCGGDGCFEDNASDFSGLQTDFADASTLFPDWASGVANDPHSAAHGQAYQTASVTNGGDNKSEVTLFAELYAENEPLAFAQLDMHHFGAAATAEWQVADPDAEGVWIESLITIFNWSNTAPPPNPLIYTEASLNGTVIVESTELVFLSEPGDILHVGGTLMGLDGPHTIDINTTNSYVQLIAREYIDPAEIIETQVDHVGNAFIRADQTVDFFGAGLVGETSASATLHAYGGTPSVTAGDYNADGVVDAADYVMWAKTDGSDAGYNIWRLQFGDSSSGVGGTGQAVPETGTATLLMLGAFLALSARRGSFSRAPGA